MKRVSQQLSRCFFYLLLPGLLIYNFLLAYDFIPPFLKGYQSPLSIIYIIVAFIPFLFSLRVKGLVASVYFLWLIIFYIYILLYILSYIFLDKNIVTLEASWQVLATLTFLTTMFLIGYFLQVNEKDVIYLSIFLVVYTLFFIGYAFLTGEKMFNALRVAPASLRQYIVTYQSFANVVLIIGLLLISYVKKENYFYVLIILFYVSLFYTGARSEFVAGIIGGGIVYYHRFGISIGRVLFVILVFLIILSLAALLPDILSDTRHAQLLNLSENTSWIARKKLNSIAYAQLLEHPIQGTFGGHIAITGKAGTYAHNITSIWAGLGIGPFIIYMILCLQPVVHLGYLVSSGFDKSSKVILCFTLGLLVLILILFAKSYHWPIPGLLWGLYLNYLQTSKNE